MSLKTGTIGNADSNLTATAGNKTVIIIKTAAKASISGLLSIVNIRLDSNSDVRFKIFKDDGTNYVYLGQWTKTGLSGGLNSNIIVTSRLGLLKNYLLGYYVVSGNITLGQGEAGNSVYYTGDVTSNIAKASWTALDYIQPCWGTIQQIVTQGII
jgi:hypothetical protein